MRNLTRPILAAAVLAAAYVAPAGAAPMVELRFRGSGLSCATLSPGQTALLDVVLVTDVPLIAATLAVGTDEAIAPIVAADGSSGPFLEVPFTFDRDEAGTFGGLLLVGVVAPGTYDLGDILFGAGAAPGTAMVSAFQRDAIDGWYDAAFNSVDPWLGTASILVIPEPDTLLLVGLGFAILAARRRPPR